MKDLSVVFDLDGTLVDTAPDLIVAANHVLQREGFSKITQAALRPAMSYGARRMLENGLVAQGVAVDPSRLDRMTADLLAFYACNVAVESVVYPGVPATIEALVLAGAPLSICTNKSEALSKQLLAELRLDRYFKAICGRDTFTVSKPHPGHLLQTIARAGGDPTRAVLVGDSEVDIATGAAAGVPVVAVTYGYSTRSVAEFTPDAIIDDIRQLPTVLLDLRRRRVSRVRPP